MGNDSSRPAPPRTEAPGKTLLSEAESQDYQIATLNVHELTNNQCRIGICFAFQSCNFFAIQWVMIDPQSGEMRCYDPEETFDMPHSFTDRAAILFGDVTAVLAWPGENQRVSTGLDEFFDRLVCLEVQLNFTNRTNYREFVPHKLNYLKKNSIHWGQWNSAYMIYELTDTPELPGIHEPAHLEEMEFDRHPHEYSCIPSFFRR